MPPFGVLDGQIPNTEYQTPAYPPLPLTNPVYNRSLWLSSHSGAPQQFQMWIRRKCHSETRHTARRYAMKIETWIQMVRVTVSTVSF